jgi:hypothetical protein
MTKPKREPVVPAKVKDGIHALFEQPVYDLAAAAAVAQMPTWRFREAMKKPHIRRWAWHEKRALLETICAGNPVALAKIRETSGNDMARVGAIKTLEAMRVELDEARNANAMRAQPGLTIVIENRDGTTRALPLPSTPMIDVSPTPVPIDRPAPRFEPDLE